MSNNNIQWKHDRSRCLWFPLLVSRLRTILKVVQPHARRLQRGPKSNSWQNNPGLSAASRGLYYQKMEFAQLPWRRICWHVSSEAVFTSFRISGSWRLKSEASKFIVDLWNSLLIKKSRLHIFTYWQWWKVTKVLVQFWGTCTLLGISILCCFLFVLCDIWKVNIVLITSLYLFINYNYILTD